ncbi:MAG: hypothetical protein ACTSRZ_01270 [Promethearchaeota archaeon]
MSLEKKRGFIILFCLIFIIMLGLNIFIAKSNMNSIYQNDTYNSKDYMLDSVSPSTEELPNRYSPFFNHSLEDGEQYYKLTLTEYSTLLYRHSFNNTGEFNITDSNVYSSDQFYYLMSSIATDSEFFVPIYYQWYKDTYLWDNDTGGFFTKIDENLTKITDEKSCFDNALAILGLIAGIGFYSPEIESLVNEQWNNLNNLFWDPLYNLFNHSTTQTSVKHSSDNLLAAIAAFNIAKQAEFNSSPSLLNSSKSKGIEIMEEVNSTFYIATEAYPGFKETTSDSDKYLLTNALGIIALLEWNIAEGYDNDSKQVQQAIKIYNFMKTHLYNSTHNMYNYKSDNAGIGSFDYNLRLLENAWMLKAIAELFKSTGNITYYEDALKLFYGIENTLYDSANYGYNDVFGPEDSDIKSVGSYSMLLNALAELKNCYDSAEISIFKNQTSYLYLNVTQFNVTINLNYSLKYNYNTTEVNSKWNYDIPIENAKITFILRYENNSIIEKINTTTDSDGNATLIYSLDGLPMGKYSLTVLANKSGYCLEFNNDTLELTSGLIIIEYIKDFDKLYQGETKEINVSIGSLRHDNITCNLTLSGEDFAETYKNNILIENYTLTYAIINITVNDFASPGIKNITLSLFNNSLLLYNTTLEIEISFAIEVESVFYNPYILDNNPSSIEIKITNNRKQLSETQLQVETSGIYFESSIQLLSQINASETKIYTVSLIPKENAIYGTTEFNINLSRAGVTVFSYNFTITLKPSLIVNKISASTTVIHGQKPMLGIEIQNYNSTPQQITVKVNGKEQWSGKVYYGKNNFAIELDAPYLNPYDIKSKIYSIEIYKEGQLIAQDTFSISQQLSISNLVVFYIIPVVVPISLMLYFKHKQLEFEKRIK